jgi:arabinan endo-1,5-alpha-L-arabinosidase
MSITIDGVEYKGIFIKQATENKHRIVMTFTALGENVCVWGSKQ